MLLGTEAVVTKVASTYYNASGAVRRKLWATEVASKFASELTSTSSARVPISSDKI